MIPGISALNIDSFTEMSKTEGEKIWGDYLGFKSTPEGRDSLFLLFGSGDYSWHGDGRSNGYLSVTGKLCWALLSGRCVD